MAAGVTEAFNDVVTCIIDTPELWSKDRPTTKTKRPVPRDAMAAAVAGQQRWCGMAQQQQRGMGSSKSSAAQAAVPAAVQCGAQHQQEWRSAAWAAGVVRHRQEQAQE